jgi:hypothetical protein
LLKTNVQTKVSRSPIVGEFANASSLYLAVTTPRRNRSNPARPFDDLVPFSGSLIPPLHGESSTGSRRSWAKAGTPFWSNHVAAWYRGTLEAETYCRKHDLSTASLMPWARHLLSARNVQNICEICPKKRRNGSRRKAVEAPKGDLGAIARCAHGQRSDYPSGVLGHACRSDELHRNGTCRASRSAGLSPHSTRSPGTILRRIGLAFPASSECPADLSSAANCARCKYRLTP